MDLGPWAGAPTYATGINTNGAIAAYAQPDASSARALLWRSGIGFVDSGSLGGTFSTASAVGADGRLYGTSLNGSSVPRGFVYDPTSQSLTDLGSMTPGDSVSVAGVNALGTVVGTTTTGGNTAGFQLTNGTFTLVGPLPGADAPATSAAYGIDDAGQIAGVASWISGGTRAFRTDATGAPVSLGTLGGNSSTALAINATGQVAGYSTTAAGETHACVFFDGAGMRDLGVLSGGHDSRARAINAADDVAGTALDSTGASHAVVWLGCGAIRDLGALIPPNAGWMLEAATGIDDGGDIVGYGRIGGQEHAFLLQRYTGPDTQPPVAVATATPPAYVGATTINVIVEFWDNEKVISASTRATGAVRVRGPNLFDAPGTATSWTTNDSQVVNVTYSVPAPGGSWGPEDNGTYEVYVSANQVSDLAGNKMPNTLIGTFTIGYQTSPTLSIAGLPTTTTTGTPVSLTLTATSSYPSARGDVFTFTIDWAGDGSDVQTVTGPTNTVVQHSYIDTGTRIVRVHCTDPNGVQSADSTANLSVTMNTAQLPVAQVLSTQVSQVGTAGTVAAVNGGTMYFFGPPFNANLQTTVATWNYLTAGSAFTASASIGGDSTLYAGAAVDNRSRVILFGGSNGDSGALSSARSYPSTGSVASLPIAIASAVTATDNLGRIYAYSAVAGLFFRYTAGTTGSGTWATLSSPGAGTASALVYDGADRLILFTSPPSVYTISADAWTQPLTAPSAFTRGALGADGLVYLVSANQIWTFDPVLNTFAQAGFTTYNEGTGFALPGTDGFLYLIGGNGVNIEQFDTRPTTTSAPAISSTPSPATLIQGVPWTYAIAASGKPRPTFSLVRGPDGMSVDSTTGVVSWTPTLAQVGTQTAVVRATNSQGTVGQTLTLSVLTAVPDTTPPTPPSNVAVSNITTTSADITWSQGTDDVGVAGYRLFKKTVVHDPKGSGSTTHYSMLASTGGTSLHLSGLSPVTNYPYYLASVDAAGNQSAYTSAAFTSGNMSAPGIINGNNGASAGTWAVVGEAFTSYTFTGSGVPQPTLAVVGAPDGATWNSPAGTSGNFTWTPVAGQEGTASFTLSATNSSGTMTQTYTVPVYPAGTDLAAPTAPGGLVVDQVSWNSCRATWTASIDNHAVAGYRLVATHLDSRVHPPPYADETVTSSVGGGVLQTTLTGLRPSTAYDLSVQAFDAAGNFSAPATVPFTTLPQPFAVPATAVNTNLNADSSTTMTWAGYGAYWLFTVETSADLVNWTPVPPASQWPAALTTFTFTPDPAKPSGFYRVRATPGAAP